MPEITPTLGEKLQLYRRMREKTQREMAKLMKVPANKYIQWELDQKPGAPDIPYAEMDDHEICYLLRRRAGMTQAEVAKQIGRSRLWVQLMELGKTSGEELTRYWRQKWK